MTVFNAIKDGQEYKESICTKTGYGHNYVEVKICKKSGRIYQTLKCETCGLESTGYYEEG